MTFRNEQGIGLVWVLVVVAVIGVAGVGYMVYRSGNSKNEPVVSQATNAVQPAENAEVEKEDSTKGTVITSADSQFGPMLFNADKQAIYIWEVEKSSTAECYGDCAEAWPPVLTDGAPVASGSVKAEMLGTTKRTDGTTQVTYNDHPLYYYANEKPGEVKCHNIVTHGGLWWVIQPNGVRAD